MTMFVRLPLDDWLPMESWSIASWAVSRAKTLASLDLGRAWKDSAAAYGQSSGALLANYDPDTSSWKTSQPSFSGDFQMFSDTLPNSGMTRSGTLFRLPLLAPTICDNAFGLLPTPMKGRCGPGGSGGCKTSQKLIGRDWYFPTEAEQLMGFPTGWTELESAETP